MFYWYSCIGQSCVFCFYPAKRTSPGFSEHVLSGFCVGSSIGAPMGPIYVFIVNLYVWNIVWPPYTQSANLVGPIGKSNLTVRFARLGKLFWLPELPIQSESPIGKCNRTGTRYPAPCAWYQVHQVPGTKYLVPGTWYQVAGARYLVPGASCLVPGIW